MLTLLIACTGPIASVATHPQADTAGQETSDTSSDVRVHTGQSSAWDAILVSGQGWWSSVAVVQESPLQLASSNNGFWDGNDFLFEGFVASAEFDLSLQDRTAFVYSQASSELRSGTVVGVGDVRGDGTASIASVSNAGLTLLTGPFPATADGEIVPWAHTLQGWTPGGDLAPCDADQDGQPDLCTALGVDRGPIDGTPDTTWPTDFPDDFARQHLAIGRTPITVAWIPTESGVAQLDLTETGALDPGTAPTWMAPASHTVTALASVDPDGDGLDALLVCSGPDHAVRLLDSFPADSPPFLTLDAPCDALEVADFDGDGALELAVGAASRVRIHELDGTLLAEHVGRYNPGADGLGKSMDSADIDGDGRADLLVAAPDEGALYLTLNAVP